MKDMTNGGEAAKTVRWTIFSEEAGVAMLRRRVTTECKQIAKQEDKVMGFDVHFGKNNPISYNPIDYSAPWKW